MRIEGATMETSHESRIDQLLVDSYAEAATKARRVFLITNFATIVLLIAYFNLHWTWLRHFAEFDRGTRPVGYYQVTNVTPTYEVVRTKPTADQLPLAREYHLPVTFDGESTLETVWLVPRHLMDTGDDGQENVKAPFEVNSVNLRESLVERVSDDFRFVNFSPVGAKVFSDDLPVLGGVALAVIMTWYFYVRRRERGIMQQIASRVVQAANRGEKGRVELLFYGTALKLVFNSIEGVDEGSRGVPAAFARLIIGGLLYAPCIVLSIIFVHDLIQTFLLKMAGQDVSLIAYLSSNGRKAEVAEIVVRLLLGLLLLGYSYVQAWNIHRLAREDSAFQERASDVFREVTGL